MPFAFDLWPMPCERVLPEDLLMFTDVDKLTWNGPWVEAPKKLLYADTQKWSYIRYQGYFRKISDDFFMGVSLQALVLEDVEPNHDINPKLYNRLGLSCEGKSDEMKRQTVSCHKKFN
jgi:hypothetical protein